VAVKDAGRAARSANRATAREPERPADSTELIQLLTPEGERVEHPDYPLEISAAEVKALYATWS
jgi:2-oxoisovalerate dehydrogenase E1 component alpha subunit